MSVQPNDQCQWPSTHMCCFQAARNDGAEDVPAHVPALDVWTCIIAAVLDRSESRPSQCTTVRCFAHQTVWKIVGRSNAGSVSAPQMPVMWTPTSSSWSHWPSPQSSPLRSAWATCVDAPATVGYEQRKSDRSQMWCVHTDLQVSTAWPRRCTGTDRQVSLGSDPSATPMPRGPANCAAPPRSWTTLHSSRPRTPKCWRHSSRWAHSCGWTGTKDQKETETQRSSRRTNARTMRPTSTQTSSFRSWDSCSSRWMQSNKLWNDKTHGFASCKQSHRRCSRRWSRRQQSGNSSWRWSRRTQSRPFFHSVATWHNFWRQRWIRGSPDWPNAATRIPWRKWPWPGSHDPRGTFPVPTLEHPSSEPQDDVSEPISLQRMVKYTEQLMDILKDPSATVKFHSLRPMSADAVVPWMWQISIAGGRPSNPADNAAGLYGLGPVGAIHETTCPLPEQTGPTAPITVGEGPREGSRERTGQTSEQIHTEAVVDNLGEDGHPGRNALLQGLANLRLANDSNWCYVNAAFLTTLWSYLSLHTFSLAQWGSNATQIAQLLLQQDSDPIELSKIDFLQPIFDQWQNLGNQGDPVEFLAHLMRGLSFAGINLSWEKRVQIGLLTEVMDESDAFTPLILQFDPAMLQDDSLTLCQMIRDWSNQDGMVTALTHQSPLYACRLTATSAQARDKLQSATSQWTFIGALTCHSMRVKV